ncbi:DUF6543 domain-containing protein [Pseudomonas sp. NBRC 111124]|uniref:DUF6543 domain-containing protein n=1 Tax=Pseudomonas sp. NBRC 111124 TaxID=1661039 RepID=UPI000761697E|nr:DUF6543 domain-containing protein [Pseudomonas sp. NBRC 111124]
MPSSPAFPAESFKHLVANSFAHRPGLSEVVAKEGFLGLVARYPWISRNYPALRSLQPFSVIRAHQPPTAPLPLVPLLLEHFLTGEAMALGSSDTLSIEPPLPFLPQQQPVITLSMAHLNSDFDTFLAGLADTFQQAQISYWAGVDETTGAPRLKGLAHLLKAVLLSSIERQGLAEPDKGLLYAAIAGSHDLVQFHALQVSVDSQAPQTIPDLLITGHGQRTLWCQPGGTVRSYASLPAFAKALADRYPLASMSWAHQPVTADPFEHQALALLNATLDNVRRLQVSALTSVGELEAAFLQASDPAAFFQASPLLEEPWPDIAPPAWLTDAEPADRFHYSQALLAASASQARSKGATSLDRIEPIEVYAARTLRAQMQADHPGKAVYDPDQLAVEVSEEVPLSSAGPAQLVFSRNVTLTQLAIARLQAGAKEVVSGLSDTSARPIETWLTLDYLNELIDTVDVGGNYPGYVATELKDTSHTAQRTRLFAREWRYALLFAALKAKASQQLSDLAYQAIARFCQAENDPAELSVAQLAFLAAPGASRSNVVHGAFLLKIHTTGTWLVFWPLLGDEALMVFGSLDELLTRVRTQAALQQKLLLWMDDDARPIYENGGFERPHLHRGLSEIAHLIGPDSALADTLLEQLRSPATLAIELWHTDLDACLYQARIETLLMLAANQSVSNAQQRWAMFTQLGWMLFNTATALLRGPAATLAWLVAVTAALKDDLPALAHGSTQDKALAATDLLMNLAMLLIHRSGGEVPAARPTPTASRPAPSAPIHIAEPELKEWVPEAHSQPLGPINVTRWHANQRISNLTPEFRKRLVGLQARISLAGLVAEQNGALQGLYTVADKHYVILQGLPFEVETRWGGVQIIGPDMTQDEWETHWGGSPDGYYIVGRERSKGPWLTRWNGEWTLDLSLAGGMRRSRTQISAMNAQAFAELEKANENNREQLSRLAPLMERSQLQLKTYDRTVAEFSAAFAALPDPDLSALPPQLLPLRQRLLALRIENINNLTAVALYLERQAALLQDNLAIFTKQLEPRFRNFKSAKLARSELSEWTETAIENDMVLLRRLMELTDHEGLRQQAVGLTALPRSTEQIAQYTRFREATKASLQVCLRLRTVSERLDTALPAALADPQITFSDKKIKIERAIRQRPYSTLIIRAQILSDLAYLTLDKTQLTAETATDLLPLQRSLSDKDLAATLWSHDGLAAAGLSAEQQADALGSILRTYRTALGKAHYMGLFEVPAVDSPLLEQYIDELRALVASTEAELSSILTSIDTGTTPTPRPLIHRAGAGRRTLIRTSQGRSVLVEQDRQGNRALQQNPLTQQPAGVYEKREGEWFEVPSPERPIGHDRAQLRRRATHLLNQTQARTAAAARYVDEPNSLADLMDWQIEDLLEAARQLEAGGSDQAAGELIAQLRDAATTVGEDKNRLLTDSYLNTRHPDGQALRYLHRQQRIEINQTTRRKALRNTNDYLDVYQVKDVQAPTKVLWEIHFHYLSPTAPARDFAKGHLKFWEPRPVSRAVELERADTAHERLAIYRGNLRVADVEGIVPFPAN